MSKRGGLFQPHGRPSNHRLVDYAEIATDPVKAERNQLRHRIDEVVSGIILRLSAAPAIRWGG